MMMEQKLHLEIALPITVGDNVWIGTNVSVLPGVTYFRAKLQVISIDTAINSFIINTTNVIFIIKEF